MEASETTALKPPPQADRSGTLDREPLTEAEYRRRGEELVAMVRDLGFGLDEMGSAYPPRTDFVDNAAYLMQETVGAEEREIGFHWVDHVGLYATDEPLRTLDIEERADVFEAGLTLVTVRSDEEVAALKKLNEILEVPDGFSGTRAEWLVLLATVHRVSPRFRVGANYLDLNHADSGRFPSLWEIARQARVQEAGPQDMVDVAYGRLIRKNIGSAHWKTNYDDSRFDMALREAVRTWDPETDFDLHLGRTVRKAAYNGGKYTAYPV